MLCKVFRRKLVTDANEVLKALCRDGFNVLWSLSKKSQMEHMLL